MYVTVRFATWITITIMAIIASSVATWYRFKRKIKALREFIVELDEAIKDDKVTEEEFRRIWQRFKDLIYS